MSKQPLFELDGPHYPRKKLSSPLRWFIFAVAASTTAAALGWHIPALLQALT